MSEPEVIETEDTPGPDMESTIREAYRELSAKGATEGLETTDEPSPPTDEAPGKATERVRGPDGKFAKTATDAPVVQGAPPTAAPAQDAKPYDAYPGSWKKDHEPKWKALDPTLREEIHRREQNFLDGIKEYKESAAFGKAIGADLLPHLDTMRKIGTTPQLAVREVFGTWAKLVNGDRAQKQGVLLQLARDFGIDMPAGAAPSPQNGAQPPANGVDFSPVLQRVETLEQSLRAQEAERQRLESDRIDSEIAQFAANPKNEHFQTVREEMGRLMTAGLGLTLDDAYIKAVWANPETRAKEQAKVADADRKRQAEEAAAARKAAGTNVQRRGTPPAVQKPGSIEDTIRSEYRRLTAEA